MPRTEIINIHRFDHFNGKHSGFQHESLRFVISVEASNNDFRRRIRAVQAAISQSLGPEASVFFKRAAELQDIPGLRRVAYLIDGLIVSAGLPELDHQILRDLRIVRDLKKTNIGVLICESFAPRYHLACMQFLQRALDEIEGRPEKVLAELSSLKNSSPALGVGTNVRHLVRAAHRLRIPVCKLPGRTLCFGMGVESLTMQSSLTAHTSAVGVKLARDKASMHDLLAMAGLPVTVQRVAVTAADALTAARDIGYPVVIKPRALDGGKAVTTNITDDAKLKEAFSKVAQASQPALVERHVFGNEYRLLYINGRLVSIHERVPARVLGNGVDTIEALIRVENNLRAAAEQTGFSNIPIYVGDDTHEVLAAQQLGILSVPAAGQMVRLATVPKVATGGQVQKVDPADFHPDILASTQKAVLLARLDIAGVDFITSAPSRSWKEAGGAITEINACPQINRLEGHDVHSEVLRALIKDKGRVPCVLLLVRREDTVGVLENLADRLASFASSVGVLVLDQSACPAFADKFACMTGLDGAPALLANPTVFAVVTLVPMSYVTRHGFPLDRVDLAAVLEPVGSSELARLCDPSLRPHMAGRLLLSTEQELPGVVSKSFAQDDLAICRDRDDLFVEVANFLCLDRRTRDRPGQGGIWWTARESAP